MKFGLSSDHYVILERLVIRPLINSGARVWIFGSRATGQHRPFSDVDLMFEVTKELPKGFLFEIKSNIEESDFPYKVDLVERAHVAQSYRERIEKEKIDLF